MAQVSSGSFTTSYCEGMALKFSWSVDSTSISGNYKKIYWSLVGNGTAGIYVMAGNFKVVIDGETVYEKGQNDRIQLWNGTAVANGYKTLYHNSTGNKSFSASVEAGVYYYARNVKGSGSWELPTIPRYLSINTFNVSNITETSLVVNWATSDPRDSTYYTLDGGSNWIGSATYGETLASNGKSGSFNITGLNPNTKYNLKIKIKRTDSQLWTESSNLEFTTYDYPKVENVGSKDLIIGNSQTLTIYNPLSRNVTITMYKDSTSGTQLYTDSTSGTSITFTPTANTLYASIPNSKSGKAVYTCIYSSFTKSTTGDYTYTVNESSCIPTFSEFTYKDINTTVTDVTGNNQILVKGLSNLQVTISSANKMVAKNSATASKYIATIDTLNKSVNYSTSDVNLTVGNVANAGTKRLTVTAYDSRTISKAIYKDITIYDYSKPVVNASISRLNNFEAQTTLKVSGTYTRLTVNGTDKNTISSVQYRYRQANGTWGAWNNLNTTVTSGKFNCSDLVLSLDNTKSFEFEIKAIDKLDNNTTTTSVDVGEAIFFVSTNKKACYINGEKILMANELLNIVYPVGSIYMSVNTTNPATLFGGTWVQLKDRFLLGAGDSYNNGATGGEATHTLTTDEMPSHNHAYEDTTGNSALNGWFGREGSISSDEYMGVSKSIASYSNYTFKMTNTGGSQPHNNMPPYLVVYMWKRTA